MSDHDAVARQRARTVFSHPVVVEAGAGTGKTTTLIARICTWCLGPGWEKAAGRGDDDEVAARVLDGVVAITFTDAAAAEMASRFGAALVGIAAGRSVLGLPELPVDAVLAMRRARALLGAVDRLVVSTIHAFCARILALAPTEAGLHPAHRVDADGTLLAEVVHEVVVDWFTEIFVRVPEEKAPLLRLAEQGIGSEVVVAALTKLAAEAVPAEALEADAYSTDAIVALLKHTRQLLAAWLLPARECLSGATLQVAGAQAVFEMLGRLHQLAKGDPTRATLQQMAAQVHEPEMERLAHYRRGRFDRAERATFETRLTDVMAASAPVLALLGHLVSLQPELLDAGRAVLQPLLSRVTEELRRRGIISFAKMMRGAHDLLRRDERTRIRLRESIDLLLVDEFQDTDEQQCDLVRMLALEGSVRPSLFLVGDPKQSIYGWRTADLVAYDAFVDEVVRAGGEKLLLDVNRRSLTPILDEVDRVVQPIMRGDPGYQAQFQRLYGSRESEAPPPSPWQPVEHWLSWKLDATGAVLPLHADDTSRLEAEALATDLLRLHHEQGLSWDRVGILFRSTTDLEVYLRVLRDAGIPHRVERNRQYYRRREVIEAAALIRCLLEPEDTLALLTVLRSPLVGAPDAALLSLWREHLPERMAALSSDDEAALAEIRRIAEVAASDALASDAPGVSRVAGWEHLLVETAAAIGWLRASYESLPADRFVAVLRERLPLETLYAARYLGEFRLANLERFYEELVRALSAGDPQSVLRALRIAISGQREAEDARPGDGAEQAVRILTIHKAKGLDFDHVYVLQLHKGRRTRWRPDADATSGNEVRAWKGHWEYRLFGARTPGWHEIETHAARVEENERVRLLYVAMTRARNRLVLVGKWPLPGDAPGPWAENLLDLVRLRPNVPDLAAVARAGSLAGADVLWKVAAGGSNWAPGGAEAVWEGEGPSGEVERRLEAARRMQRGLGGTASGSHGDAAPVGDGSGREVATVVGTAVHAALEHVDLGDSAAVALRKGMAVARGVIEAGLAERRDEATDRARALLKGLFHGPLGEHYRSLRHHLIARELPLLSPPGEDEDALGFVAGSIDLLHRDPATGDVVVVDYKTDAVRSPEDQAVRAERYGGQMAVYVRAVQAALGLEKPPRAELWFVVTGERVVVPVSA